MAGMDAVDGACAAAVAIAANSAMAGEKHNPNLFIEAPPGGRCQHSNPTHLRTMIAAFAPVRAKEKSRPRTAQTLEAFSR
jgi:hypothetical protein